MGKIATDWKRNVSLRAAAPVAAAQNETSFLNVAALGADVVDIQTEIVLGSADSVKVEFFRSVDDGVTLDTNAFLSYTAVASETRTLKFPGETYIHCKITNNDGVDPTGNITQRYAWRDWLAE